MSHTYFSDRELGPRPRVSEEIPQAAWGGICAAVGSRITDGSFGYRYPIICSDGGAPYGCDARPFALALVAEISVIAWPLNPQEVPPTLAVLDLLEFCFRAVGQPVGRTRHDYFDHYHLTYNVEAGCAKFRQDINRILARNGVVYELDADGRVIRLAPPVVGATLKSTVFRTGDAELDSLLEAARTKYLDPDPSIRRESLEKLWDAWERLKTIEPGSDKKSQATELLKRIAPEPMFREILNAEAVALTGIGNTFRIRHSETSQIPIEQSEHIDYLFHRLFSFVRLALRSTGRGE